MKSSKFRLAFLISILVLIWSVPLFAGVHSIRVEWEAPTHEVKNDDCTQLGDVITDTAGLSYTILYRKVGDSTWQQTETTNTNVDISGLVASTTYEVMVGARYPTGTILCWTDAQTITTPIDQPPQSCTGLTVSVIK